MTDETLACPNCQSRLRWAVGLEAGVAVMCPRCRTQFVATRETTRFMRVATPEARTGVHDPSRFPEHDPPRPFLVEDDEDYPKRIGPLATGISLHLRVVCSILGIAVLGTLLSAFYEIRCIILGGPVVSLLGIYVGVLGRLNSFRLGIAVGLSALVVCLFTFILINVLGWGPDAARIPVWLIGLAYSVLIIPILVCVTFFPGVFRLANDRERV